jgi:hypothetical protein
MPVSLQVLGWVSLITVAGVSFYYAKQSINERRRQQDIAGERPSARLDCEYYSSDVIFVIFFFLVFLLTGADHGYTGKERIARNEEKSPQAQRKEYPVGSNSTPIGSSRVSSSTDDTT